MGKIKILYLEDNPNDSSVLCFKSKVKNRSSEFEPLVVVNSKKQLLVKNQQFTFDVIICDIEIWEKAEDGENELTTLGFSIIDYLNKKGFEKIYYIVTNTTRSFFDIIKSPKIKRVRLKDEVFGNDAKTNTFLDEIKKAVDAEKETIQRKQTAYQKVFEQYDKYIRNKNNYRSKENSNSDDNKRPLIFKLKGGKENEYHSYREIKNLINSESKKLEEKWDEFYSTSNKSDLKESYKQCSTSMKDYIKKNIGYGSSKFVDALDKTITDENIGNFITKLILRRFYEYMYEFVKNNNLKDIFNSKDTNTDIYTVSDVACYAISKENKIEAGQQSHCYDQILLF